MTWIMPIKVKFNRGPKFGLKDANHPNGHRGCDYNGFPIGTPLYAVSHGRVVLNQWSDVLGNVVVIQVGSRFFGYCHMNHPSPLKVDTVVEAGTQVGTAGTTGSASTGCHLHLTLSNSKEGVFSGEVEDADAFLKAKIAAQAAAK
jgi:murein DD-endopeptidase MepM/ murein hydrolase activator NlpD